MKVITPKLFRCLYADPVTQLRCDFSRFKTLIAVPGDISIVLAELLFGEDHLLQGDLLYAVDGGDKIALGGFFRVLGI